MEYRGKLKLVRVAKLPNELIESSGLLALSPDRLLSINDGGNPTYLYEMDSMAKIKNKINMEGVKNTDWEEITSDGTYGYIGDFGNNRNNRKQLEIYKFPLPTDSITEINQVEKIIYTYKSQVIPTPANRLHYDVESMVAWNDSLFLFSKNRTTPFDGWLYLYSLPSKAGKYEATAKDSIHLGDGKMIDYWITGAALSPDKKTLVLISYSKIWIFNSFQDSNFFGGKTITFDFEFTSQKEAVCFKDNGSIYITNERALLFSEGSLYEVYLSNYLN